MQQELVVALAVAPILCASALATLVEFKLLRKSGRSALEWIMRIAFQYALPSLALCGFSAYIFSTFIIIPYYPGSPALCHVHDPECLARVDPSQNYLASVAALVASELLGLGHIVIVAARRTSPRHIIIHR